MDHGPELTYQSGLERDQRQDEARAKYPGRDDDEFPTAYDMSQASQDLPSHMPIIAETRSRVCGLRVSTFSLLATVIVLLALAGVGMGILGSRMKSKGNDSAGQNSYSSRSTTSNLAVLSSTASWATSLTSTSSLTSSTTSVPAVETLQIPNDGYGAVQPQYTIERAKGELASATFDISYDTNSSGGDFMSFYSPSTASVRAVPPTQYPYLTPPPAPRPNATTQPTASMRAVPPTQSPYPVSIPT